MFKNSRTCRMKFTTSQGVRCFVFSSIFTSYHEIILNSVIKFFYTELLYQLISLTNLHHLGINRSYATDVPYQPCQYCAPLLSKFRFIIHVSLQRTFKSSLITYTIPCKTVFDTLYKSLWTSYSTQLVKKFNLLYLWHFNVKAVLT